MQRLSVALRGSAVRGVRAARGEVLTALGLSSSLLIVHASKYEQKPVDVTKSANKFASAQDHIATSGAQNVQPPKPNGCQRRTMIPWTDQRAIA
jgi:hypothetical protein